MAAPSVPSTTESRGIMAAPSFGQWGWRPHCLAQREVHLRGSFFQQGVEPQRHRLGDLGLTRPPGRRPSPSCAPLAPPKPRALLPVALPDVYEANRERARRRREAPGPIWQVSAAGGEEEQDKHDTSAASDSLRKTPPRCARPAELPVIPRSSSMPRYSGFRRVAQLRVGSLSERP